MATCFLVAPVMLEHHSDRICQVMFGSVKDVLGRQFFDEVGR